MTAVNNTSHPLKSVCVVQFTSCCFCLHKSTLAPARCCSIASRVVTCLFFVWACWRGGQFSMRLLVCHWCTSPNTTPGLRWRTRSLCAHLACPKCVGPVSCYTSRLGQVVQKAPQLLWVTSCSQDQSLFGAISSSAVLTSHLYLWARLRGTAANTTNPTAAKQQYWGESSPVWCSSTSDLVERSQF